MTQKRSRWFWPTLTFMFIVAVGFCVSVTIYPPAPYQFKTFEEGPQEGQSPPDPTSTAQYFNSNPISDPFSAELVLRTIDIVSSLHHRAKEISKHKLLNIATIELSRIAREEGVDFYPARFPVAMKLDKAASLFESKYGDLRQALSARGSLMANELSVAVATAVLQSLGDSHTYFDPPTFLAGKYSRGSKVCIDRHLGLSVVELAPDFIYVERVVHHGNASASGLGVFDRIVAVDDVPIEGGIAQFARILEDKKAGRIGPVLGYVSLDIVRKGENRNAFVNLVDAIYPAGDASVIECDEARLHCIKISLMDFWTNGYVKLARATDLVRGALKNASADGVILDLRGNLGGEMADLESLCSIFMPDFEDMFYSVRNDYPRPLGHCSFSEYKELNLPMVVLVDERTFSAGELFAQVMKERGRAKVVGSRTYGGVQVALAVALTSDEEFSLSVAIERLITVKGAELEGVGVEPDLEVPLTEKDISEAHDTQLEAAIKVLLEMAKK